MRIISDKRYKELKEAENTNKKIIINEKCKNDLLKLDCCDYCYSEYTEGKRRCDEINDPKINFAIHFKTIHLCAEHFYKFKEFIEDTSKNEHDYLMEKLQEEQKRKQPNIITFDPNYKKMKKIKIGS